MPWTDTAASITTLAETGVLALINGVTLSGGTLNFGSGTAGLLAVAVSPCRIR